MDRRNFVKSTALAAALGGGGVLANQAGNLSSQTQQLTEEGAKTMKHKVKITVLRREFFPDLAEKYLADPKVGKCPHFEDG